jgi:hypothetical protein
MMKRIKLFERFINEASVSPDASMKITVTFSNNADGIDNILKKVEKIVSKHGITASEREEGVYDEYDITYSGKWKDLQFLVKYLGKVEDTDLDPVEFATQELNLEKA